jgi:hypothetical protein
MPLEAVVLVMDNSEFNRNGDFAPSRWESQQDAASNICDVKLNQNPENTIGVMTMAGQRVEVKLTQSPDIGQILNSIADIEISKINQILPLFRWRRSPVQRNKSCSTFTQTQNEQIITPAHHSIRWTPN